MPKPATLQRTVPLPLAQLRRLPGSGAGLQRLALALLSCLLFLIFAGVFAERQLGGPAVAKDFQSFYIAGYLAGHDPSHLYSLEAQRHVQNLRIAPGALALPYFHPPYEAALFAPLSWLPYHVAYRVFMGFQAVLLFFVILLLPELATRRFPLLARYPSVALFTFAPVLLAVLQGQDSVLFLVLGCMLWRAFQHRRDFVAGCLLGLMLFRFQLALPLLLLLALRCGFILCAGFFVSSVVVLGVSFALVGRAGMAALFGLLSSGSLLEDSGQAVQNSMAIHPLAMPNLFGLLYAALAAHLASTVFTAVVLSASAVLLAVTAYRSRTLADRAHVFSVALLCSMLVSYHMYLHDLSLLVLPLTLLRTRAASLLGLAAYLAAFLLVFSGRAEYFFLLAVPVACLLWHGWTRLSGSLATVNA